MVLRSPEDIIVNCFLNIYNELLSVSVVFYFGTLVLEGVLSYYSLVLSYGGEGRILLGSFFGERRF